MALAPQLAFRVRPDVFTFTLVSTPVTAKVQKLKANWTCEVSQNLVCFYNVKAEEVLLNDLDIALSKQVHETAGSIRKLF